MQTPGRTTEPQTPMIPMERRSDVLMTERLQRATEESKNLERPQTQVMGRIISQMEDMNGAMKDIREQIRADAQAKRKYFRDEQKLIKKDSDNLNSVKSSLLVGLRGAGAFLAAGSGAAELQKGNIGGAAQGFGLAGLLMAPEILEFLTGSVINVLALKGLIGGGKGGATSNIVAGVSKTKNPLLLISALAASLLIPALAKTGQTGDQRRQELATRNITGEQTINKPDVSRFRTQLDRFDRILSGISVDRRKSEDTNTIDLNNIERDIKGDKRVEVPPEEKEGGFFDKVKNFFNFNKEKEEEKENKTEKKNDEISLEGSETNIDMSQNMEGDNINIEGGNIEGSNIAITQDLSGDNIFDNRLTNIFESNEELASALLPNSDIKQMGRELNSTTTNNVIDLSSDTNESQPQSSGFSGIAAKPATVFVSTKFTSGGGVIDRFESATSLRTYGAFS